MKKAILFLFCFLFPVIVNANWCQDNESRYPPFDPALFTRFYVGNTIDSAFLVYDGKQRNFHYCSITDECKNIDISDYKDMNKLPDGCMFMTGNTCYLYVCDNSGCKETYSENLRVECAT